MNIQDYIQALDRQAAADAAQVLSALKTSGRRGFFIDCGSNLGQGFKQFSRHFSLEHFDYVMVEPNPNCWPALEALVAQAPGQIALLRQAASTRQGSVRFFGLEQDPTSQGGSMLAEHNSKYYAPDDAAALDVPCFDLAALIAEKHAQYGCVVLKLDIEGGEYEVLPHLVGCGAHKLLSAAYIEFHSQYMAEPGATGYRELEARLKQRLVDDQVALRIWI